MGRKSGTGNNISDFYGGQSRKTKWLIWQQKHALGKPWPGYGAVQERMEDLWRRWGNYNGYKYRKPNSWETPPALDCSCEECAEKIRRLKYYETDPKSVKIEKNPPLFIPLWAGTSAVAGAVITWLVPAGIIFQAIMAIAGGFFLALFLSRKN